VYIVAVKRDNAPNTTTTMPSPASKDGAGAAPASSQAPGSYIAYSPQAFVNDAPTNRKVLFFHASWCPQCRAIEQDIYKQGVPSGMTIFKVDYDNSSDLKMKYGITLQTTFVELDSSDNLLQKHVAYNEPTLPAVLEALGQ